jgi:hypothetical protein
MITVFRSRSSGKYVYVDQKRMRVKRLRRRVKAWSDVVQVDPRQYYMVLVTLTYVGVGDWRPNHVRDFIKRLKRLMGSRMIALAWVAELQERGAMHYHVMCVLRRGSRIPKPDKSGLWLYGSTRVERARSIYYLLKYTSKGILESHLYSAGSEYPKGARIYATYVADRVQTLQIRVRVLREGEMIYYMCYGWEGVKMYRDSIKGNSDYCYVGSYLTLPAYVSDGVAEV